MAVKSMRIANAASGVRVQAIDAIELDGDGYATVMERIVAGSAKLPTVLGNATRGQSAMISTADTQDLTTLSSDLTNNLITVGDACLLVVVAEISVSTGIVVVTPLAFDTQTTPVVIAPFESKAMGCSYTFRRGSTSGNYVCNMNYWDTKGAYKIGLHVTSLSSGNTCKLWGFVI